MPILVSTLRQERLLEETRTDLEQAQEMNQRAAEATNAKRGRKKQAAKKGGGVRRRMSEVPNPRSALARISTPETAAPHAAMSPGRLSSPGTSVFPSPEVTPRLARGSVATLTPVVAGMPSGVPSGVVVDAAALSNPAEASDGAMATRGSNPPGYSGMERATLDGSHNPPGQHRASSAPPLLSTRGISGRASPVEGYSRRQQGEHAGPCESLSAARRRRPTRAAQGTLDLVRVPTSEAVPPLNLRIGSTREVNSGGEVGDVGHMIPSINEQGDGSVVSGSEDDRSRCAAEDQVFPLYISGFISVNMH